MTRITLDGSVWEPPTVCRPGNFKRVTHKISGCTNLSDTRCSVMITTKSPGTVRGPERYGATSVCIYGRSAKPT